MGGGILARRRILAGVITSVISSQREEAREVGKAHGFDAVHKLMTEIS